MIRYDGRIVQFGFGAVGKSFYEKISREIAFDEKKYIIITREPCEFQDYVNFGGLVANFVLQDVNRDNFKEIFASYLESGDLLIDFADTVGTRDICEWCARHNIMYINTGEADWPDHWYSIFEENEKKEELQKKYAKSLLENRCPIVLQHGNNPGLVSHFVKAAIEYVVRTQFKRDRELKMLIKEGKFQEAAYKLGIRQIHVNDIDLQKVKGNYDEKLLFSTWCTDSFWFEMLSEATLNIGSKEEIDFEKHCNFVDRQKGFLEFQKLAAQVTCTTYYPGGVFEGFLVPHEETVSIAKSLEVKEGEKVLYRPTVAFVYRPCDYAREYFQKAKVNSYPVPNPSRPMDCENVDGKTIIRGYVYPENFEIVYQEKLESGTEYVGILLLGEHFKPVWVGNRIEPAFLYKDKKYSFWQTPTITPVAMSALAAVCWMLQHRDKGGIYFPDDIPEYKDIIKRCEKYISKTIYKTFETDGVQDALQMDLSNLQIKDLLRIH